MNPGKDTDTLYSTRVREAMDGCTRLSTNVYLYNKYGERQQYSVSVRPITGSLDNTLDVTYFFISLLIVKTDPNNRNRIVPKKGYMKVTDKILNKKGDPDDKNVARKTDKNSIELYSLASRHFVEIVFCQNCISSKKFVKI